MRRFERLSVMRRALIFAALAIEVNACSSRTADPCALDPRINPTGGLCKCLPNQVCIYPGFCQHYGCNHDRSCAAHGWGLNYRFVVSFNYVGPLAVPRVDEFTAVVSKKQRSPSGLETTRIQGKGSWITVEEKLPAAIPSVLKLGAKIKVKVCRLQIFGATDSGHFVIVRDEGGRLLLAGGGGSPECVIGEVSVQDVDPDCAPIYIGADAGLPYDYHFNKVLHFNANSRSLTLAPGDIGDLSIEGTPYRVINLRSGLYGNNDIWPNPHVGRFRDFVIAIANQSP